MCGTEKTIVIKPLITNKDTRMWPIASPIKNFIPWLKENEAPTPAKASTAGPGVMIKKNTAETNGIMVI